MVIVVPQQAGPAGVMHIAVSVPRVPQLLDGTKYMLPGDVKPPESDTERRFAENSALEEKKKAKTNSISNAAAENSAPPLNKPPQEMLTLHSHLGQLGEAIRRKYQRHQQHLGPARPGGRDGANSTPGSIVFCASRRRFRFDGRT